MPTWYGKPLTDQFKNYNMPPAVKESFGLADPTHSTAKIAEFKKFIYDLIEDKKGALPDVNDWKKIKSMMDQLLSEPPAKNEVRVEYKQSLLRDINAREGMPVHISEEIKNLIQNKMVADIDKSVMNQLGVGVTSVTDETNFTIRIPRQQLLNSWVTNKE